MRRTSRPARSAENSWSRNTVRPSLSESWNQSRQVTRLPVQLWKYSWATTLSTRSKSASVAVRLSASTQEVLKMFRPLFSIAPILKSPTATTINTSKSYSRPKRVSSHFIACLSDWMAKPTLSASSLRVKNSSATWRPLMVVKLSDVRTKSPATSANR